MYVVQEGAGTTMKTLDERISDLEREVQSLRQEIKRQYEATLTIHIDPSTDDTLLKSVKRRKKKYSGGSDFGAASE